MSDRVCQFFLRGRCQRAKCEFRHPADRAPSAAGSTTSAETNFEEKKDRLDQDEAVSNVEEMGTNETEPVRAHLLGYIKTKMVWPLHRP